jgi:threonine aldolase
MIDLRSDTVTRPTPAMRDAMARAEVGDDVFGDDPTVNALQQRIAQMLGFEAALFVPSGTQGNLCALMSHCQRGDEYLVGQMAHTYRWEGGGARCWAASSRSRFRTCPTAPWRCPTSRPRSSPMMGTSRAPGCCAWRTPGAARCCRCRTSPRPPNWRAGTASRPIWTVHGCSMPRLPPVATRCAARRIAEHFDSVSVCFSKGLGAPVGSALCGSKAFIARAHRWRKMLGGGMRQAGIVAAGALHALEHHIPGLAEDHANARLLADGLQGLPGVAVEPPQTNIVFVDLAPELAHGIVDKLREQGVLCTGLYRLRFVTHLDVDRAQIESAIKILHRVLQA